MRRCGCRPASEVSWRGWAACKACCAIGPAAEPAPSAAAPSSRTPVAHPNKSHYRVAPSARSANTATRVPASRACIPGIVSWSRHAIGGCSEQRRHSTNSRLNHLQPQPPCGLPPSARCVCLACARRQRSASRRLLCGEYRVCLPETLPLRVSLVSAFRCATHAAPHRRCQYLERRPSRPAMCLGE